MTASHPNSLFTKFKETFTSKQTVQFKQDIEVDEPFRHFAPGDSVKGTVHLDVAKPLRATHLVIRLYGFVKVVMHSKLPGESIPYDENLLNSTKGHRGGEYFGNGFAKLFEDEHVLCGDGRLAGKYGFRFEVLLPRHGTPSSIDFENGTITYLLSSTLTRPTTISPTSTKHMKLKVKEIIDIALIPQPRPQTISLESVSRRRPVMHMKRKLSGTTSGKGSYKVGQDDTREAQRTSLTSPVDVPGSPVTSELSSTSLPSSGTSNTQCGTGTLASPGARSNASGILSLTSSDKVITAQTEVLQGGCLPGDLISIKVSIDHTKPIKNMQGVIITFYRLARIDTHPAIPLGPSNGKTRTKHEDIYPRSRTGLGGLSFSSSGSTRTFRQDLNQNIAPLIVDPQSLTATLRTSVQVPEHTFPSISRVPGSMISFKYFVEIVLDLSGKLGQDRLLSRFSMTDTPQHAYEDPKISMIDGKDGVTFSSTPGFNFLITDQIRRQKGVVYTKAEVILGTKDSTRSRGKQKEVSQAKGMERRSEYSPPPADLRLISPYPDNISQNGRLPQLTQSRELDRNQILPEFPLPHTSEEPSDEKARIRQAEQTLLPSAPPEEGSLSLRVLTPSAPFAYDEDDYIERYHSRPPAPDYEAQSPQNHGQESQPSRNFEVLPGRTSTEDRLASPDVARLTEDKQELERRRLLAQVGSPPNQNYSILSSMRIPQPPADPQILAQEEASGLSILQTGPHNDSQNISQSERELAIDGLPFRRRVPLADNETASLGEENTTNVDMIGGTNTHTGDEAVIHNDELPAYRR
ncbi:uncharacterized protein KY384_002000 [Bacidia gigantensis]|uniref:uncharacterized protein n=1 Tax=Bacidia gigantensis TaxID=2732470 RepID=UPI001D046807|nr:uncharacterized protein KY384_002000 [Bacidia gigantensis]KAG8533217.1 hypothetical protein KY384_002000 [Bacidia gigantensis]